MRTYAALVLLVAALCVDGRRVQVDSGYYDMRSWCAKNNVGIQITHVENWEDNHCKVTCKGYWKETQGENSNNVDMKPFSAEINKPASYPCENYYYSMNDPARKCLNGNCYAQDDIRQCENEQGKRRYAHSSNFTGLYALEPKVCSLACGGNFVRQTEKSEGSSCCFPDNPFAQGTCRNYTCDTVSHRKYVNDTARSKTNPGVANEPNAIDICKSLYQANSQNPVAKINNDICCFLCFHSNVTHESKKMNRKADSSRQCELLTFTPGHICGDPIENKVCDGDGKCVPNLQPISTDQPSGDPDTNQDAAADQLANPPVPLPGTR